jgi:hypothetical protein
VTRRLKSGLAILAIAAQLGVIAQPAAAFSGLYVAKSETPLFNKASKIVLAWDNGKTAITMASDYEGDPKEFAVVVPVPTPIERKQISIVEMTEVDHLDAYSAPRLVEYDDPDPCASLARDKHVSYAARPPAAAGAAQPAGRYAGVTVEASYAVGEYDIAVLSAEQSRSLVDYLADNGYRIPDGADPVLASYIKQKMHFFVARVNLDRMEAAGHRFLRPLQVRYDSPKFMLPIRLGTANADGPQDLIVLALTRKGRVETTNYRTVKMPSDVAVPLYVKEEFGHFYAALFDRAVARQSMRAVFVEYAWDLGWCDPCSTDPMTRRELASLGAGWIGGDNDSPFRRGRGAESAFLTRLHIRYDAQHFPEDLILIETADRSNFQSRYMLLHPWRGAALCPAGRQYHADLPHRFAKEARALADLTGWSPRAIHARMQTSGQPFPMRDME